MREAQKGDTVRVHLTGCLDDGTKFASTFGEEPLELTIGEGKLIECFESSLIGMSEGAKKTVRLEPSQAMGEIQPELVSSMPRHMVSEQFGDLKVGARIWVKDRNANDIKVTVRQVSDQAVTIDANHPLAGEALTFDIELMGFV
jgi:peptidylprolyl isomerase